VSRATRRLKTSIAPRLLTREQAAHYCGVSIPTLVHLCPIKPIALGNSKRLERYDVRCLDDWIDAFSADAAQDGKDWLAALDENDDGHSGKGN
jgi:hypothetical protein